MYTYHTYTILHYIQSHDNIINIKLNNNKLICYPQKSIIQSYNFYWRNMCNLIEITIL